MTAHPNPLLAPGAAPVIGRLFEASANVADLPPAPSPSPSPAPLAPPVLPFVGTVVSFVPRTGISVARQLSLDHDLFLADHNFVHAPGVKPLADCFPVVPMTVSLEVMAQTAACLAPGLGLVGFEAVTARRWIAVADGGTLALRIEARVSEQAKEAGHARIAVQIFAGEHKTAAIEGTACFGAHHQPGSPALPPLSGGTQQDAAALYRERHLFHGPRFQCLSGPLLVAPDGASATLLVREAGDWFADQPHPQLLTDAALLDTVGQAIAVWAMQGGHAAFPIGLEHLDLHGPTPPPGSRLPLRLRIGGAPSTLMSADIEIGDGDGGIWARIRGWKSWLFAWAPGLMAFQRQPERVLLADEQALPDAGAGYACRRIRAAMLKGFDPMLLARHYLHACEWPAFVARSARPQRQREWLLGRIAVKDAARAWSGQPALHPATFAVLNDAAGQPSLAHWPHGTPPCISIAHTQDQAIGMAGGRAVGIDIEAIAPREAHCVATVCTPAELRLLAAVAAGERDAWIGRLWCAKEALGKRLGTGVAGGPHRIEAVELYDDFSLRMRDTAGGVESRISTIRDDGLIIAFDTGANAI